MPAHRKKADDGGGDDSTASSSSDSSFSSDASSASSGRSSSAAASSSSSSSANDARDSDAGGAVAAAAGAASRRRGAGGGKAEGSTKKKGTRGDGSEGKDGKSRRAGRQGGGAGASGGSEKTAGKKAKKTTKKKPKKAKKKGKKGKSPAAQTRKTQSSSGGRMAGDGGTSGKKAEAQHSGVGRLLSRKLAVLLMVTQLVFLVLMLVMGRYGPGADGGDTVTFPTTFPVFQDVSVMIMIGFGFLMVFLRSHTFTSVGVSFVLAVLAIQVHMVFGPLIHAAFEADYEGIPINLEAALTGNFAAGAVLISFGVMLGTVSPFHMAVAAIIEVLLYTVNEEIGLALNAVDAGGSMTIHMFGAYFGVTFSIVSRVRRGVRASHPLNGSTRATDTMAMIGTLFLWVYWPSFNSAIAGTHAQERAAVNTTLSLLSSCVATVIMSQLMRGRVSMVDMQNASLAGGVAVGASADLAMGPGVSVLIGTLAGVISVLGFRAIGPALEQLVGLHDTCGAHNLHGLPSVLAGIFSVIGAATATRGQYGEHSASYSEVYPELASGTRTAAEQALAQLAYVGTTLLISLLGGILAGFFSNLVLSSDPILHYTDQPFWQLPSDAERSDDDDDDDDDYDYDRDDYDDDDSVFTDRFGRQRPGRRRRTYNDFDDDSRSTGPFAKKYT